jgi:hypothetical protein
MYGPILIALEEIAHGPSWRGQDVAAKADGFACTMKKTTTFFGLLVARAVLGLCDDLATALQGVDKLQASTCVSVDMVLQQLTNMSKVTAEKRASFLDDLWDSAKAAEESLDLEEPTPPRRRIPAPKLRENGAAEESVLSTKERMAKESREAIVAMKSSLEERFKTKGIEFVWNATNLILSAATKGRVLDEELRHVVIHLGGDLDIDRLRRQLPNLHPKCSSATDLQEVIDAVIQLPDDAKLMISEVMILLTIMV